MKARIGFVVLVALALVGMLSISWRAAPDRSGVAWAEPDTKKDGDKEEEDDPIVKTMKIYKSSGKSISQGFKLADKERILDGANKLVKAAKDLGALYPLKDDKEGAKDFQAKADALAKSGADFVALAQKSKTDSKSIAALRETYMDKVRPSCMACHTAYIVTFKCQTKDETWTQPKWEEKHCPICGKKDCGTKVENEEDD